MKLGKLPARHDPRELLYEAYAASVPAPPLADTDNLGRVGSWGMLGNDNYGDCVWAGADHETILWTKLAGKPAAFTPDNALADYSAVTGFNPADPNSDQGTDVRQALSYRRRTGVVDALGKRHKLSAYLSLEPGNHTHIKESVHLFDGTGIGFEFPVSAMAQFNAGHPWSVVAGAKIDGGHYVNCIGYDSRYLYVVTWGRIQKMTWGFFAKYCDEAYALLSSEYLRAGRSPEGFDLPTLTADLKAL